MYNTPILFVIFNRKDVAVTCFEQIKKIQPTKLYIAGDGPRADVKGEENLVKETRESIINAVDWDCELQTLFQNQNLGCKQGVYTAVSWLLENEESGLIIEDDCLMRDSFFKFTEQLLEKFKDDSRVGMICGANYAPKANIPDSYVFSRYKSCHGWATWRRAWKYMDIEMTWAQTEYCDSVINNMGYKSKDVRYWKYRQKAIDIKDVNTWDWQWYFTLAANSMMAICPKHSLTSNIGFGEGATHTSQSKIPETFISHEDITFPLKHPKYVVPYQPFEKAFYHSNNTLYNRIKQIFPFAFKNMIKKIVRR